MIGENKMKKVCSLLLVLCLAFSFFACDNDNSQNELVNNAIKELKSEWKNIYDKTMLETDRYFEIKNTRVITIKETDIEEFKDVKYIVEFVLYTDYFGSAPYHSNYRISNSVIVYNNGDMKVPRKDLLEDYSIKNYIWDYSNIIDNVKDYGDKYNCVETLK